MMGVRIIRQRSDHRDADRDFLRVSTCSDPDDHTVTLATIQRVVDRPKAVPRRRPARFIKTLVMGQPMSLDAALGFATCYAERKKIPVIYAEQE